MMGTPTKAAVSRQSASGEVRLTTTWANIIIIFQVIIIIMKLYVWTHLLLVLVVELELDIGGTNHPDHRLLSFNVRLLHFLRNKNINSNPNVSLFLNNNNFLSLFLTSDSVSFSVSASLLTRLREEI